MKYLIGLVWFAVAAALSLAIVGGLAYGIASLMAQTMAM